MPLPVLGAIAAQAAGSLIQGGIQGIFNDQEEQKNIRFYNMQRQDALSDWRMNNEYNSPVNNVQRLKQAGISPHIGGGQSIVAAATAQRPQTGNRVEAPRAYQVNQATNTTNMQIGLEQIENLRAQNQKLQAETQGILKDNQQKGLTFDVNSETQRSTAFANLWKMAKDLQVSDVTIEEKQQQVQNMKQTMLSEIEKTQLLNTQNKFEGDYLKGRNKLQGLDQIQRGTQTQELRAQIENINARTKEEIQMLPFKIRDITERIAQLKNDNESRTYQNMYMPEHLRERNQQQTASRKLTENELQYIQTLPPEIRYAVDKAPHLLEQLMKARFYKKY